MKKKIYNLVLMLVIGGISGALAVQVLLPWLAGFSFFNKISWIRQSREGTTVINQTEQINISQDQGLENAVAKVNRSVVLVVAERNEKVVGGKKVSLSAPEITAQASGLIVSNDGLIITADAVASAEEQKIFVQFEDKKVEAQILKHDKVSGLALLKVPENNLFVLPFFDGEIKLGEVLFLVGAQMNQDKLVKFVDMNIVRQVAPALAVDFFDKDITGSPVFNIKGETVGIRLVISGTQSEIIGSGTMEKLLK